MQSQQPDFEVPSKSERYRQIFAIVARHGLGFVGDAIGAKVPIRFGTDDRTSQPEHVRLALEELGTTFIKLGQALAARGDLLPPDYRAELSKLHDSVSPLPGEVIEAELRRELGTSPHRIFAAFDHKAIASASIGQVHAAQLRDGQQVVLKVRKPHVESIVECDLEILADLAVKANGRFPALAVYDLPGLVAEFSETLRGELDFNKEADNIRYFTKWYEGKNEHITFPTVLAEFSTKTVLTMTRLHGYKIADAAQLPPPARAAAGDRISRFILEPAFADGVFYADPHPGNFFIQQLGGIGVMDFGMIGRLSPALRRRVADMFIAMEHRDAERLCDRFIEIAAPTRPIDRRDMTQELDRVVQRYLSSAVGAHNAGETISDLLEILRRYQIPLPSNLAYFFKALALGEGVVASLNPSANISRTLSKLTDRLYLGKADPRRWAERTRDTVFDAAELTAELPRRVDRVLGELERGTLHTWTHLDGMDRLLDKIERMTNRLTITMCVSAVIIALSVLTIRLEPAALDRDTAALLGIGAVCSLFFILWVIFAFLRRR
jgi:ubiquinone biosynthesis protein